MWFFNFSAQGCISGYRIMKNYIDCLQAAKDLKSEATFIKSDKDTYNTPIIKHSNPVS